MKHIGEFDATHAVRRQVRRGHCRPGPASVDCRVQRVVHADDPAMYPVDKGRATDLVVRVVRIRCWYRADALPRARPVSARVDSAGIADARETDELVTRLREP